jgi:glycosyltransferase involved in cell wall biosynthesis
VTDKPRRVLSIGHSYCVALNRRLPSEIACVAGWEVTVAAPRFFHGDLRPIALERALDESCGVEPVDTYFSRHIHLMLYGRRLRQLLQGRWDLIHSWEEPYIAAGGQVAWLAPPGVPLVYATFQNISKTYPPLFNWIERYAMRRASGWIAFGETVAQAMRTRPGFTERPSRVIPVGVDVAHFQPDRRRGGQLRQQVGWTGSGAPVVGFIGRFVPEKGLDRLVRVLDRLTTPWRALLVGSGPLEDALRKWGRRHPDSVRIVTGVTHDEVPRYLNAVDLLCVPSQTLPRWREQFGRTLIEAFACGVPVVGSDSGEIPYVVADAGVIVPESADDEWVRAIDRLIRDPDLRRELAARGLERARTVYAWPRVARQHVQFFETLLDETS